MRTERYCDRSGRQSAPRNPAPPASAPLRGFGGGGGTRRHQPNGGFREIDRYPTGAAVRGIATRRPCPWRGKDRQDWSDLVVQPPQLYIQEKVHPKAIIDDLIRRSKESAAETDDAPDLFADFNGINDPNARLEFYQHDQHWSNRMILGDALLVMASLAEREHLRGQVQCIYFDPPYGIQFNSNWQVRRSRAT